MELNIGKLTGTTLNGTKIYQKVEDGIRVITTVNKNKPLQEIKLEKYTDDMTGYHLQVKDLKTGVERSVSDVTDNGFAEQFRTKTKAVIDANGNTKRISVTTSKDGDMVEITKMQGRPNGEEFWLTKNTKRNTDKTTETLDEFETSYAGWTKNNGENVNGFIQKSTTIDGDNNFLERRKYGNIDTIPTLNELV